jgi:biopolymer transport protein ExbD
MKYQKRLDPRIDIPIVNIGDIAFLLIIFFILSSAFMRETYIKLTQPTSIDITRMKDSPVSVTVDQKGDVWLQGTRCNVENLDTGVMTLLEGKKEKVVMLKIDKALVQKQYGPVLMALSKAGAEIALIGNQAK